MQNSQLPAKWYKPFAADDSNKVEIPVTTADPTRASQSLGFPPLTMQPPESGGVPPQGEDFNGAMNQVARIVWWMMAGGAMPFDASFAGNANINGYPSGARVVAADLQGVWINGTENNSANPDTVGTGWTPLVAYGVTALTSLTGGTITPTPAQAMKPRITLAGALTSNLIINLPTWLYGWTIVNNTTGAFTVTVKTAGGGGVGIPQNGAPTNVRGDGTNIIQVAENIALATLSTQPLQAGNKGLALFQGYTTAGTFNPVVPAGVFRIHYKVWGAGGGGGGGATTGAAQSGNGAGSGGYCEGWMAVTPGQTLTAIVGAQGTGGANTGIAGTAGGNSSLSNGTLTVTAGGGGFGAGGGTGGGIGGTATNGDLNIVGGNGTGPLLQNSAGTQVFATPGGSAPFTGPIASGYGNGAGTAGKAPGGGGGGGTGGSSGAFAGGNGAPGAIYLWA